MSFSLFPRTVYKTKSKISGEIVVKELLGQHTLSVQGMIQSGGITKDVWKKAMNRLTSHVLPITNVLVLGLGGGTVVKLIDKMFLKPKIVGVEIDPEIVKIGKKYFDLDEIKNLKIITADALEWVKAKDTSEVARLSAEASAKAERDSSDGGRNIKFDLIIVDLYLGDQFPPKAASEEFLKNLKKLLSKKGILIFNQLKNKDEKKLIKKLKGNFSNVDQLETPTNLFFFVH